MEPKRKKNTERALAAFAESVAKRVRQFGFSTLQQELRAAPDDARPVLVYSAGLLCGVYVPLDARYWLGPRAGAYVGQRLEIEAWYVSKFLESKWEHLTCFDAPPVADVLRCYSVQFSTAVQKAYEKRTGPRGKKQRSLRPQVSKSK